MPERKPLSLRHLLFGRPSELAELKQRVATMSDDERQAEMRRIAARMNARGFWFSDLGGGMAEWRHRPDDSGARSLDERLAGLVRTGTTPEGVPTFERVRADYVPCRIGACFAAALGLGALVAVYGRGSVELTLGGLGLATVCALCGCGGVWAHYWLRRLVSLEELGARTGVRPDLLAAEAARMGTRPACVVDGEEQFDPRAFGAATLLRAASLPEADALPRPASAAPADAGTLPRPAGGDDV